MYSESVKDNQCRVQVACDRKHCPEMTTVFGDNHDDCQMQLYLIGWRLHRHKQLCTTHAREVIRRMNRSF